MSANDRQEGGDHYQQRNGGTQPWDVVIAWELGFLDGNALKYIARWRKKGGIEDLKKARHYIDKQIEQEEGKISASGPLPEGSFIPHYYSVSEGGSWIEWKAEWGFLTLNWLEAARKGKPAQVLLRTQEGLVAFHAVQAHNMRVWDSINGWRVK